MKRLFTLKLLLCTMLCIVCGQMKASFTIDGINYNLTNYTTVEVAQGSYIGEISIPASITYQEKNYDVTGIASYAFYSCSGLTAVSIPSSITSIGNSAFMGCTNLTSIEIPDNVTDFGDLMFYGCTKLKSIKLPDSMTTIRNGMFYYCSSLTSFEFPNGVTSIENDAFCGCSLLKDIVLPDRVTRLGSGVFSGCTSQLTPVYNNKIFAYMPREYSYTHEVYTIPNGITTIAGNAFNGCSGLTTITIPNSVTSIGRSAFGGCTFNSIDIPNSVIELEQGAFEYCSLHSITIPESMRRIGDEAFMSCSELESVTFLNGVETIGDYVFAYCSKLTSVSLPNSLTSIGSWVFNGSNLSTISIPKNVSSIGIALFANCEKMETISVENGNSTFDSRDNCNAIIETSTNTLFSGCKNTVIPNDIACIIDCAFMYTELSSVTIPNSVRNIGLSAFMGTKLSSVTIPSSVTDLAHSAFENCNDLTSVIFDNCAPNMGEVIWGEYVFLNCPKLTDIYYPAYAYNHFENKYSYPLRNFTLHPQIKIDREWTTYCASASFDVPEGIDAYVVKSYNGDAVTLKKVSTINEGEGLLMRPAVVGATYDATLCAVTPTAYESNLMKGVTEDTSISPTDGDKTNFIFTKKNGNLGFYPTNAGTFPAYKAYLQLPTASVAASKLLTLDFEDEAAAINDVVPMNCQEDNKFFNLSGQRVTQPTKGLYIVNGKKMVIK